MILLSAFDGILNISNLLCSELKLVNNDNVRFIGSDYDVKILAVLVTCIGSSLLKSVGTKR